MRGGSGPQSGHSRVLPSRDLQLILNSPVSAICPGGWSLSFPFFFFSLFQFSVCKLTFVQDYGKVGGRKQIRACTDTAFLAAPNSDFFSQLVFLFLVFSLILLHALWIAAVTGHFLLQKITRSVLSVTLPDTWVCKPFLGHAFFDWIQSHILRISFVRP